MKKPDITVSSASNIVELLIENSRYTLTPNEAEELSGALNHLARRARMKKNWSVKIDREK